MQDATWEWELKFALALAAPPTESFAAVPASTTTNYGSIPGRAATRLGVFSDSLT
jgi:hypothetical protein